MLTILVQAGHEAPRDPNHLTETGAAGEGIFATAIADALTARLRADGRFAVKRLPGLIPPGTRCAAAIFEHADGSANKMVDGYSFGYPAAFPVNKRLAALIADEYARLPHRSARRRDNYTPDLAGYYGFSRTATTGPEVVVESGFVSNPTERVWLMANVRRLADAQYRALCRHFVIQPLPTLTPPPSRPPARYSATDQAGREVARGQFIQVGFAFVRAVVAAAARGPVTIHKL